jgi:hypothetical protein
MAQRSPPSASAVSVNPTAGQTLVLIAADGVRVSVNRAIATEASYVLRDLLDGQDLVRSPVSNNDVASGFLSAVGESSPQLFATDPPTTMHDLEDLFEDHPTPSPTASQRAAGTAAAVVAKTTVPDLMDFFSAAPSVSTPPAGSSTSNNANSNSMGHTEAAAAAASPSGMNTSSEAAADDILASLWNPPPPKPPQSSTPTVHSAAKSAVSTTHVPALAPPQPPSPEAPPPPPPPPAEVELAFPYFSGDILERVCRHMSYRFRMSSFGTEDGCYRVYMVKTRVIPRPMTLPLTEYLDLKDRRFIADWDELITVQMVKAATLLNYEELLQLASAKLASYLIERDLEGVRTLLGVESDFDAVEEGELRKEQVTEFNR